MSSRTSKFVRKPLNQSAENITNDDIGFEELQERLNKLNERKLRRKIDLENAKKQLKACEEQAKEMGADNYEELERKVKSMQEEEEKEMEAFVLELTRQEEILDTIERELENLENE